MGEITNSFVKANNSWAQSIAWVKVDGTWRQCYSNVKINDDWRPGVAGQLELYSPGTEALRSSLYNVEVYDGTQFSSAYVFSGARTAIAAYGLDDPYSPAGPSNPFKNKLWLAGSKPVLSYLTFGTNQNRYVRVSKPGTSVTSIDIRPRSKNIPYQIYGGSAVIELSKGHKVWVTLNNELSSPLFIFADDLKPPIPTTGNYYYFEPGVHEISAIDSTTNRTITSKVGGPDLSVYGVGWSAFPGYIEGQPYTIYLDGGAYVRGTINTRNKNNLKIIGPGILAGDNLDGQVIKSYNYLQSFSDYVAANIVMIQGPMSYEELAGGLQDFSTELGYSSPPIYNFSGVPSGVTVSGITVVNSPWYTIKGMNNVNSVKVLSPWEYSTDGPSIYPDRKTKFGTLTDNFVFVGDDAVFTTPNNKNYSPAAPTYSGSSITSGITAYSMSNGPVVLQYRSYFYFPQADKSYQSLMYDMDVGSYSRNRPTETVIRATTDNLFNQDPTFVGLYDVTLSNVRVEDTIDTPLFWMGNIADPYANGDLILGDAGNEYGAMSGIVLADITASGSNNNISGNPVWGRDQNNKPYNILFKNIKINNEYITESNRDNFITWNRQYDPELVNVGRAPLGGEIVDVYFYIGDSVAYGVSGFASELTATPYASIADQVTGCYIYRQAPAWDATAVTGTRFEIIRPGDNTAPLDYYYFDGIPKQDPLGNMSSESVLLHKLRNISDRDIYLIKSARGGTMAFSAVSANGYAAEDWSISSVNEMYDRFELSANSAIATLRSSGKNPNLRGGVIFLGTNVPSYYNDRAFTSSMINREVSSLLYSINNLFESDNDVAADYANIVWVTPHQNIGDTFSDFGYYMERVRAEVSSFENIFYKHHFYTPSAWGNATYFADFSHPNTSGYIEIAEDIFDIFDANTSSVTNPTLNPGVNITFVTGT